MTYKLLAVDMDGTLLNEQSQISERTRKAVLAAMDRGVLFVPSTGRPMGGMRKILDLFDGDLPMILFNGAMAVTARTERVLFSQGLAFACAETIFAQGVERGYSVVAWTGERLFVSNEHEEIMEYRRKSGAELHVVADAGAMRELGVTKMLWIIPPRDGPRCQSEMHALLEGKVNCHTSCPHLMEFVDAKASKGLALEAVGKAYGIAREEMIAVGDGWNDVSMLEYAGLGVAMGNAPAEIKRLCQYTTLSNEEDGAAAVIEKFLL
ncbi:MAG: Cof-type HAD-IIB family hydrolase [Firmicutes bacterium]|nr:Cof-type HAD-IIB family hydrolase [Bacillota bacterium]